MKYLTKNFKEQEFTCKCGKCKEIPTHMKESLTFLCQQLEVLRIYTGPIIINSGVRCKAHNKKVGGVPNSQHLQGKAADIRAKYTHSKKLYNILLLLQEDGVIKLDYVKYYEDKKFIHIDIRGIKNPF